MTCYLDSSDRKHLVKHYVNRSRRSADDDAFDEVIKMLAKAQEFANDDHDRQFVKGALEEIWLKKRWHQCLEQIQTFPLSGKPRKNMRNDIEALSKLKAVDVFIDAAVKAAEDEKKQKAFIKAFAILLNVIELVDQRQQKEMCKELHRVNRSRHVAFQKDISSSEELLALPSSAFQSAKEREERGIALLENMESCLLPAEMLETIIEFCENERSYWEQYRSEQQQVSDYRAQLDKQVGLHQLQERWSAPPLLLAQYRRAIEVSENLRHKYPMDATVNTWWEEAKDRFDKANAKVQSLLFAAQEGNFQPLVSEYRRILEQEQFDSLPWIEKTENGYVLKEEPLVPSSQATAQVERLARTYADAKAEKRLGDAKAILATDAVQAQKMIDSAKHLSYLSREMQTKLAEFTQDQIEPAIAAQTEARRLIEQAEKIIAQKSRKLKQKDYFEAWALIRAAQQKAPQYVDEMPMARNNLYPLMRVYWNALLRSARDFLLENELDAAAKKAKDVMEQTRDVSGFQEYFLDAEKLLKKIASQYEQKEESLQ